jgi:hypothetical protein
LNADERVARGNPSRKSRLTSAAFVPEVIRFKEAKPSWEAGYFLFLNVYILAGTFRSKKAERLADHVIGGRKLFFV